MVWTKGLKEVFDDIFPIADYKGHLSLNSWIYCVKMMIKYLLGEWMPRGTAVADSMAKENDEARARNAMGDLLLMTETGTRGVRWHVAS